MKTVLIVSPHFPPVNAPDMHRVRMSLPYYAEFGWAPVVLAVRADVQDAMLDPALVETIPADVDVVRTGALPLGLTRPLGIGNVAMRAFGHLYAAGARIIRDRKVDLVFFSTTMFAALPLGRLWKRRFGVPYVVDLQDPWFSTYYDDKPRAERPPKYGLARTLHRVLEPFAMRRADAVVAVSSAYLKTMQQRYPEITAAQCATIPFGVSERDFEVAARRRTRPVRPFDPAAPRGVYVGRGGPDMATALRIVFRAMAGRDQAATRLGGVTLEFVGTDYAPAGRAHKTVEPLAIDAGLAARVSEQTARVPYLDALERMVLADFLLLVGSDDPDYSPSKVYPYLQSGRPIVAVVHERSPIADLVRRSRAGLVVTFASRDDVEGPAGALAGAWAALLDRLPFAPAVDPETLRAVTARHLTERQCLVFDVAAGPRSAAEAAPCVE